MFVDTSAIVAIIAGEPEAAQLARELAKATRRTTSPVVTLETSIVLASKLDIAPSQALALLEEFLAEANVSVIPITEQIGQMALETLARFGKGRHSARLNLADCLSYACARAQGAQLLFKGDDFSKTDIDAGAREPWPSGNRCSCRLDNLPRPYVDSRYSLAAPSYFS